MIATMQRLLARLVDAGEDGPLYEAALAVEQDERLAAEMAEWDVAVGDGLASGGRCWPV